MMKQHIKKDLIFFFDLKANLHIVLGKNNLRIILGSKWKFFKNIEARQKIRYPYKKHSSFFLCLFRLRLQTRPVALSLEMMMHCGIPRGEFFRIIGNGGAKRTQLTANSLHKANQNAR